MSQRIAFQSKTRLSSLFKFKESIPKYLCSHLTYKFWCICCNATYYSETDRHLFVRASEYLGITPLTQKRVKNPKKSAILDHTLLKGHNATYDDFSILISKNNQFKLHLKESLLIERDRPELNRNITPIPLSFSHIDISYCNVYFSIIRINVLLTTLCFYENLDNSSSL